MTELYTSAINGTGTSKLARVDICDSCCLCRKMKISSDLVAKKIDICSDSFLT